MKKAAQILIEFEISYEARVVSAHRTPDLLNRFATGAADQGYQVIIAGAGGAAHLPGMIAAQSILPVIGVPIKSAVLNGVDSLLSIVQMPGGVPVATMAIGDAGAKNAGLMAVRILALQHKVVAEKLARYHLKEKNRIENITLVMEGFE